MKMHPKVLLTYLTTSIFLHFHGVNSYNAKTVDITEIIVPEHPRSGDDVTLTCRFRLDGHGHRLYTVNWWRGKDQFYSYKGSNPDPKQAYHFNGINVAKDVSTDQSVVLKNVTEATSGEYKCEVIGEGPSFRTAVRAKQMNVIARLSQYYQKEITAVASKNRRFGFTLRTPTQGLKWCSFSSLETVGQTKADDERVTGKIVYNHSDNSTDGNV
ncbi:uncharacterized protein LOC134784351 [Penaeus indicus]|uniref:uncharacterized protein LOC134784351 n=1 Tax=Penaeus indicus TaxID=29960 RepID=UPI00300D7749